MTRKRGLTLGKFAPLHTGHQLLIETALAEMDEVAVIIYDCPQTTSVPLSVRADWLRKLYPGVEVIEAWDGPTEVGETADIKARHEDYVLRRLGLSGITHFYSSEFYGEHMSRALGAVNRTVDESRRLVPINATRIREDPFACRAYLHPLVYQDLIVNVVFLGAPSTGKTTIASALAERYGTRWMPEYGREFWFERQVDRRLSAAQLVELAEGHLEREAALLSEANRFLFTDTNALTTYLFSHAYHGMAAPRLEQLVAEASTRYDLMFVCETDIPFDASWDRSGEADREVMQKRTVSELRRRKIPFLMLRGDLETRARQVERVLSEFQKYDNLLARFGSL